MIILYSPPLLLFPISICLLCHISLSESRSLLGQMQNCLEVDACRTVGHQFVMTFGHRSLFRIGRKLPLCCLQKMRKSSPMFSYFNRIACVTYVWEWRGRSRPVPPRTLDVCRLFPRNSFLALSKSIWAQKCRSGDECASSYFLSHWCRFYFGSQRQYQCHINRLSEIFKIKLFVCPKPQ